MVADRPNEIGVLDRSTGQVRTIKRLPDDMSMLDGASWAPDSSRFVVTEFPKAAFDVQSPRALIVDPATMSVEVVEVPENALPLGGSYVWSPAGDRLVATAATVTGQDVHHDNIDEFDLSGRHLRRIPTGGPVSRSAQYSPDGRRILLPEGLAAVGVTPPPDGPQPTVRIVDARTGAKLGEVALPPGTAAVPVWYDEERLVVATNEARAIKLKIVEIATGKVVHSIDVAGTGDPWYLHVTPATRLSEAAMKLAF
jgi:hypothetical protein